VDRREFLKMGIAGSAGAAAGGPVRELFARDSGTRPPNLLFVLADQWRFSAFGHGTDPLVETPTFDQLAADGARWTRAYAADPVCSPNRSAVITGRFPHQTGLINNNLMLPPAERCIGEVFGDAGYATHYVGKWHMDGEDKPGFVPPGWRRRGYETFEGFNRGHFYYETPTFANDGTPMEPGGYEPTFQTDLAIQFMTQNKDRPFYCYLSWGPPHTPYNPPDQFDRFDPANLEWRPNVPEEVRNSSKIPKELAGYYGLCESLDYEMGRVLTALDNLGLRDNTLVVFTADHGDMQGSHGQTRKGKPEEESLHIPMIMRLPTRIQAGQTPDTLISSIDLMPTLLSLCGLDAPGTCTGRDLSAAVLGGPAPEVESVYAEGKVQTQNAWRAVVTRQHKLAVNIAGDVTHMFDLETDPYEMNNLANQPAHAALQAELLAELGRWGSETDDTFPEKPASAKTMYTDEEAAAARASQPMSLAAGSTAAALLGTGLASLYRRRRA